MSANVQPGILAPLPALGRFLVLGLAPGAPAAPVLDALATLAIDENLVVGVGAPLASGLGKNVEGLRPFPALTGAGVSVPSTQGALFFFLRGTDAGEVVLRARALVARFPDTRLDEDVATFVYGGGRDLTGYEDGTESPKGERAVEVAIVSGRGPGLDGGSFVASQRWVHALDRFATLSRTEADHVIGRSRETNEELGDAPVSAHVKRAAQESFEPTAFMVRRSMPWGDTTSQGLHFVAYGASLDAYERVLARMVGKEDGVVDALFSFTRPVSGGYFFCPPLAGGKLDLRALR